MSANDSSISILGSQVADELTALNRIARCLLASLTCTLLATSTAQGMLPSLLLYRL